MGIKPNRLVAQARLVSYIIKKYKIDAYCINSWGFEATIQGYNKEETIECLEGWNFKQESSYTTATFEGSQIKIVLT